MSTEREVLVDRRTFEHIYAAAAATGHILCHSEPHAQAGFPSLVMWPCVDGEVPILLVMGES